MCYRISFLLLDSRSLYDQSTYTDHSPTQLSVDSERSKVKACVNRTGNEMQTGVVCSGNNLFVSRQSHEVVTCIHWLLLVISLE
jgi:hypothetical protein